MWLITRGYEHESWCNTCGCLRNPNHQLKTVVNIPWFIGFQSSFWFIGFRWPNVSPPSLHPRAHRRRRDFPISPRPGDGIQSFRKALHGQKKRGSMVIGEKEIGRPRKHDRNTYKLTQKVETRHDRNTYKLTQKVETRHDRNTYKLTQKVETRHDRNAYKLTQKVETRHDRNTYKLTQKVETRHDRNAYKFTIVHAKSR